MAAQSPHPDYRITLSALESSAHIAQDDQVESEATMTSTDPGPTGWRLDVYTQVPTGGHS